MKPVPRWKNGPIYKGISKTVRKAVCSGRPCILAERIKSESKKQENSALNEALFFLFTAYKKRGRKTGPAKIKKGGILMIVRLPESRPH
ncbi:hypothetical protein BIZ35_08590 [Heyndrickxia coagulans]|nr:hypothetical protein BIZ35_08590 [Heyndrickxia coagulans]